MPFQQPVVICRFADPIEPGLEAGSRQPRYTALAAKEPVGCFSSRD